MKSNTNHTPGPWKINDYHSHCVVNEWLEQVCCCNFPQNVAEANARLIAAAPELLEALELAFTAMSDAKIDTSVSFEWAAKLGHAKGKARAAIAKATGKE